MDTPAAPFPERRAVSATAQNNAPGTATPDFQGQESVVDGVRIVSLSHAGQDWRLGSVTPNWRNALLGLPPRPTRQELAALARRGLWLAPHPKNFQAPPLAVMCCGQGSIWPGMGRALYDTFPAAREAMDRIAAVADWDVLGIMDETDAEKLGLTRWQQPYLFLLEYAQAHYLHTLGLRPDVMSGHSLGELIALCLAGVYTPEVGWYIIDNRAKLVGQMEAEATRETGMMSVHAPEEVTQEVLRAHPDLLVSNYNTPTQFILSGPRETLTEVRRDLRKRRIPAILLNVSMAFHHPNMRVMREHSLEGLKKLEMHPPRILMMSDVTADLYPEDIPSIYEYLVDLDESPVRWVECVRNMWNIHGVRHFVEFGPADTLCGLTADIEENAVCIPAGRKGTGKEVEGMRSAVARLYALGHLPGRALHPVPDTLRSASPRDSRPDASGISGVSVATPQRTEPTESHIEAVMPIIMEASGLTRAELTPDMDLRHDLAIRSSRFPLIMHEAERRFHVALDFEDIADVATIRDFAEVLARLQRDPFDRREILTESVDGASAPQTEKSTPPVLRYTAAPSAPTFRSTPPDPSGRGLPVIAGDILLVAGDSAAASPVLTALAPWRCTFILPEHAPETTRRLSELGAVVRTISRNLADTAAVAEALDEIRRDYGRVDGLIYLFKASDPADATLLESIAACLSPAAGLRYAAMIDPAASPRPLETSFPSPSQSPAPSVPWRRILLSEDIQSDEGAELLARELLLSEETRVLLTRAPLPADVADPVTRSAPCERPERFPLVSPVPLTGVSPLRVEDAPASFTGVHDFSWYGDPWLKTARKTDGTADAPEAALLECLLETAVQNTPWLQATGAENIVFETSLECVEGVTRETRIGARALPWRSDGPILIRLCGVRLEARDVTANGRRQDTWTSVCKGRVLLSCPSTAPETPPPLWTPGSTAEVTETIADVSNLMYYHPLSVLDALLRLAARVGRGASTDAPLRLARLGQLRFSPAHVPHVGSRLELRGDSESAGCFRFHGQIVDARGVVRMTVKDICFQRLL